MEIALAAAAFAGAGQRDALFATKLRGQRDAHRVWQLARDRAGAGDYVKLAGTVMSRHLPALAHRVAMLPEEAEHDIARCQAEMEREGQIAIVGQQEVP